MKKFAKLAFGILLISLLCSFIKSKAEISYPFEVSVSGQGQHAVIFVPGLACLGEVWNETKPIFEKDFTCYSLTMAGFAGIPAQSDPSFQHWEMGIAQYIQQYKIIKPIIVGHSMGGGLAMALAADYPDLISKIIVVDALPCLSALRDPSFKTKENNDCSVLTQQITSVTNEQFYQMQEQSVNQLVADSSKRELIVDWSMKSDRRTFAEMYCDFANTDLREKISTIQCPALILLESYFVNFKSAIDEQYKNLKNANLQYAAKGLHFIMYDDKEWYLNQLKSFIK